MDGSDEMRKNLNDYFTVVIIISPGVNLDVAQRREAWNNVSRKCFVLR